MTAHWANAYIGEDWAPEVNDCWGFCRRVWRQQFGLHVPVIGVDTENMLAVSHAFRDHAERTRWYEIVEPREGDAVLMAHWRHPSHVGIWIDADGGGVLHCQKGAGVVFTTRQALARSGWGTLRFYRREAMA